MQNNELYSPQNKNFENNNWNILMNKKTYDKIIRDNKYKEDLYGLDYGNAIVNNSVPDGEIYLINEKDNKNIEKTFTEGDFNDEERFS